MTHENFMKLHCRNCFKKFHNFILYIFKYLLFMQLHKAEPACKYEKTVFKSA